jgi:F-type H+-transporting ATPase subunit b
MSAFVPALLAATEEASEHTNPLIPETNELIWGAVCFVVLLILIGKFVFPSINAMFAERRTNIEGKLDQAELDRQQAQQLLKEYQAKLDEAHAETRRLLDQARANADRLEGELRVKAEDQARRIVERAQETINVERDRALQSLRQEVGGLAVDLASRVVGESLDRDRQLRLIDQYLTELESTAK